MLRKKGGWGLGVGEGKGKLLDNIHSSQPPPPAPAAAAASRSIWRCLGWGPAIRFEAVGPALRQYHVNCAKKQ